MYTYLKKIIIWLCLFIILLIKKYYISKIKMTEKVNSVAAILKKFFIN